MEPRITVVELGLVATIIGILAVLALSLVGIY